MYFLSFIAFRLIVEYYIVIKAKTYTQSLDSILFITCRYNIDILISTSFDMEYFYIKQEKKTYTLLHITQVLFSLFNI